MRVEEILNLADLNSDIDGKSYYMSMNKDKSYYPFIKDTIDFKYTNLNLGIPLSHILGIEYKPFFDPNLEIAKYLPNFKPISNMNFLQKRNYEKIEEYFGLNYDFLSKEFMSDISDTNVIRNYYDGNNELYRDDKNDETIEKCLQ